MTEAKQYFWSCNYGSGGIDLYPYQLSLGVTFRYAGDFAPAMRLYFGPVKVWFTLT